jgi:hypothetical protein
LFLLLDGTVAALTTDTFIKNSWDVLNRMKPDFVGAGSDIKSKFGICGNLPLQLNSQYAYVSFPMGLIDAFAAGALPFVPQVATQMIGFAMGYTAIKQGCVAVNQDMFGFVVGPHGAIQKDHRPDFSHYKGFDNHVFPVNYLMQGFALSWDGKLNYSVPSLTPWTGIDMYKYVNTKKAFRVPSIFY